MWGRPGGTGHARSRSPLIALPPKYHSTAPRYKWVDADGSLSDSLRPSR